MPKLKKRTKLSDLQETHGKEEGFEPTLLEQLWGAGPDSKFGTSNAAEYEEKLNQMDNIELMRHARANGFVAYTTNHAMLKSQLVANFNRHVAQFQKPKVKESEPIKITPELEKIMREGR